MMVKELIKELSKMPQEAEVVTPSDVWLDLYCGFDSIEEKILDDKKVVIIKWLAQELLIPQTFRKY